MATKKSKVKRKSAKVKRRRTVLTVLEESLTQLVKIRVARPWPPPFALVQLTLVRKDEYEAFEKFTVGQSDYVKGHFVFGPFPYPVVLLRAKLVAYPYGVITWIEKSGGDLDREQRHWLWHGGPVIDARGLRSTIAPGETITVTIAKPL